MGPTVSNVMQQPTRVLVAALSASLQQRVGSLTVGRNLGIGLNLAINNKVLEISHRDSTTPRILAPWRGEAT